MKQYKLKEYYPSLPKDWEIGMIVELSESSNYYSPVSDKYTLKLLHFEEVEDNPKYWRKLEEKALFRDKSLRKWYKHDFKVGEIYRVNDSIFRLLGIYGVNLVYKNVISLNKKDFFTGAFFYSTDTKTDTIEIVREATDEEKKWFRICERTKKYIEKEKVDEEIKKVSDELRKKIEIIFKNNYKYIPIIDMLIEILAKQDQNIENDKTI